MRNTKQALNCGLVLKNRYRAIKFNQEAWLKSCINMNTEVRKSAKNDFKIVFSFFFQVDECSFWKNCGECKKT